MPRSKAAYTSFLSIWEETDELVEGLYNMRLSCNDT